MISNPFLRRTIVATITSVTAASAAAIGASTTPPAAASAITRATASANAERAALRDAIWGLDRSLRHRLVAAGPQDQARKREPKLSELEGLLDALRDSGQKLGSPEGLAWARKADALEPLLREVQRRERAGEAVQHSPSPWDPPTSGARWNDARGNTCADALPVGDGRLAVALGSGAGSKTGEVWLRYAAAKAGATAVSTAGSDFDTVVEVFRSCPTAGETPIARGDDEVGLQSRASFRAAKNETSWIRIGGADGATGVLAIQLEGGQAGFEGVVTDETTGQAPDYGFVQVWNASGDFVTSGYIYYDGSYLVTLAPGTYFASTDIDYDEGLLDELYDDLPCAGGPPNGCSLTSGHPIVVPAGTTLSGIDFELGHGAAIAGRVRDAQTGDPLAGVVVNAWGSAGQTIGYTYTDSVGRFLLSGMASGIAFATAGPSYGPYRRELYQNIGCRNGCDVTTGTPIPVTVGQTTPNVDFGLERFGAISGTVTRQANGSPVTYGYVAIWDSQGNQQASGYTDGAGEYVAGGLEAGQYFATTQTWGGFSDELYDDLPCEPSCDPLTGVPVSVTLGHTTTSVDFALRRMATISGALTDAVSGDPISYFWYSPTFISIYDGSGNVVAYTYSFGGTYEVAALPAGTYYVKASNSFYLTELYDDKLCPTSCDPTTGTAVTVALDGDATGIDFALTPLGKIAGTVVDGATNAAISAAVLVWDSSGQLLRSAGTSDDGAYEVPGLPNGSYFVTVSNTEYVGELYDDIPCPGGPPAGCNLGSGESVPVTIGNTTTGIDFALVRRGGIKGTVRDASSMQPLSWARVWVFTNTGGQVASTYTDSNGSYEVPALLAGNYFVVADGDYYEDYNAEVFDDVPCPVAACNPTIGTPVPVALATSTTGIDFELSRSHAITGVVTLPDGLPAQYAQLNLYDSTGYSRRYVWTDPQGRYELPAEPGTWYVLAYGGYEFTTQLYSGIPCPYGSCNVTSGTPVVVTGAANTTGIDFTLSYAHGITGRVTDGGHPLSGVAIDLWNEAGAHVGSAVTGPNGTYHLEPNAGTYFVSTDSGMGAVEELWNNVPCPLGPAYQGLCDPTTGTPIAVASWDSLASGIDFALDGVELFVSSFEPGNRGWTWWRP